MSHRFLLSSVIAAAFTFPSLGVAQLPEGRRPPPGVDPGTFNPPRAGTLDPRNTPQPAVRPGTIQRDPAGIIHGEPVLVLPGEPPSKVRVTGTGPRSITLSWSAPAGSNRYLVFQAQGSDPTYYRGSSTIDTTLTVNFLLPNTTYSYKVGASYPQEMQRGEGLSSAVSATTTAALAPGGLTAAETSKGQITLTWNKLIDADWYRLYRNGAVLTDVKPIKLTMDGPPVLRTTYDDPAGPGTHRYQIQAVYLSSGLEATSAVVPNPPVSATIRASTRVRYCQTAHAQAECAESSSTPAVIIAANTALRALRGEAP